MQVFLAQPRSFCAGVVRAIHIVEHALDLFGAPVYVLHEIVHNKHVIQDLERKGAIFVEELTQIPEKSVTIFSAHGVAQSRVTKAKERQLNIIDATCPLVTKVHREVIGHARAKREVILIGHPEHVEVLGTLGQYPQTQEGGIYVVSDVPEAETITVKNPDNLGFVTQTTLSVFDTEAIIKVLRSRFPHIKGPRKDDICYATQNRQQAVLDMADSIDILLVVGSLNSSNTNRLREVGESMGLASHLIQHANEIRPDWFQRHSRVGITAGASTPEYLVQEVIQKLETLGADRVEEVPALPEQVTFPLPSIFKEVKSA